MKKKQNRRGITPVKDNTSSCSDEDKMKPLTRSLSRKKKISSGRVTRRSSSMVDSACEYEADDSSRSDSPPKQISVDEYEIDTIEDVPVVTTTKTRKRKNTSQNKQNIAKTSKKQKANLNVSTSTPVYEHCKLDQYLAIPITPILADHQDEKPKQPDPSTPTLHKPRRKRSFSFHDPELSAISPQLSFDSGIVVSPPTSKKTKVTHSSTKPEKHSPISNPATNKVLDSVSQPRMILNYSSKGKAVLKESSFNKSCFGFDSMQNPKQSKKSSITKRVSKKTVKRQRELHTYRSPTNSTDSMLEDSPPQKKVYSSSANSDSQENLVCGGSPSLFSEDMFCENVNQIHQGEMEPPLFSKSQGKSYKGVKPKIKKTVTTTISKFDAWANSFNTQLEDIERFDLNIE